MKDSVELLIKAKKLVIEAVKRPRAGWFDDYRNEHNKTVLDTILVDEGDEEWMW